MLKFKSLETSGIEYIQLIQVCIEKECPHPGLADKSCDHSGEKVDTDDYVCRQIFK